MKKACLIVLLAIAAGGATSCIAIGNRGDQAGTGPGNGPVVQSENGTKYRVTVDDAGSLRTEKLNQ